MRADRLLSILLLLQVHRRLTAGALAERLEVSERTIYRDIDALSAAGIPVHMERGSGGGCVLPDEYRTNLTGLNEAEARTLFLGVPPRLLADLGLRQAADGALIKLLAALPAMARRDAEYARQRIHVETGGWKSAEEAAPPHLRTLQEAVWQERRARVAYRRGDGGTVERLIDPLGLVAKGRVWYLVAGVEGSLRTYRISRVLDAELTDQPCARPEGFDLAAYWAESSAHFRAALPRYPVTLRVAPDLMIDLGATGLYARVERIDPPDAEGWRTVLIAFETPEEACGYVLSLGERAGIVEPPELRARVVDRAASVLAFYGHLPRTTGLNAP